MSLDLLVYSFVDHYISTDNTHIKADITGRIEQGELLFIFMMWQVILIIPLVLLLLAPKNPY